MNRLKNLRQKMQTEGIDAFFSIVPENRCYLSGFTGSAGCLLILPERAFLLTDFRYIEQANQEAIGFKVIKIINNMFASLALITQGAKRLGFEGDYLNYLDYCRLKEALPQTELVSLPDLVTGLRSIKDSTEISLIRTAVQIADQAWANILNQLEVGQTEEGIALDLEFTMRRAGASGASFDFIVASGKRSALPHGRASQKKIAKGEFLTVDFGAVYQGYCSDITRTVILGEPDKRQKEIYELVLAANYAGIKAVKPGLKGKEVDAVARDIIQKAGYGEFFGHGLGHAVGLSVHEGPSLNMREEKILQPGMIVTVEPGVYIPDWGGVRIEDMVLVTEQGCEVLTQSPKGLTIVGCAQT
ncbi:MAG: Xaa-Pro peptidase family protein [Desulfitobacteriaceae bacterium]|nr:Xaa-Pro peptidase family protein [Desulfitobacteriaceae bacterium]MDD4346838.1 Xaa-Pro peptidase family protein [Desulfitobacteriaceae bacterium]MDD4401057.1 Xaa-Pro peptidase family protein [Desulfitobacteriaceae bacterium]